MNRSEGMHQSVRTLLELSTIEALGKLAQVPYWRCLGIEQTNPGAMAEARSWFGSMSRKEQIAFTQRALRGLKLYEGPQDGSFSQELKEAVGAYQASNGLLADGRIDFDLYASLISDDLALGRKPQSMGVTSVADYIQQPPKAQSLQLFVSTAKGQHPSYQVGEVLEFYLQSSQDAFTYCYYQDYADNVVRVFPNRSLPPVRRDLAPPEQVLPPLWRPGERARPRIPVRDRFRSTGGSGECSLPGIGPGAGRAASGLPQG